MATINKQASTFGTRKTFRGIGTNATLAWLSQIMAETAGTASGEDALSVLNRKLESAGVLGSGTANPVFANETALFYLNTTSNKLFIRGTSSYDEINAGQSGADIVSHGTSDKNRGTASASDSWIYINTSNNKVWVKNRTGSPGSYSYTWSGPIFEGTYRTSIVYNTQDVPGALSVSWNWQTDTLNLTGGGWTGNEANAKWAKIVIAPRNSNNAIASANFPIGSVLDPNTIVRVVSSRSQITDSATHSSSAPLMFYQTDTAEFWIKTGATYRQVTLTAGDIGYDPPSTGNFPSSVDTVQDALDWLHTAVLGSTGQATQNASQVPTSTTNFNQNLSSTDTNVQIALDTLDNLDVPPYYEETYAHVSNDLTARGNYYRDRIIVPQKLIDYRNRFDQPIYIIADSNVDLAETVGNSQTVKFIFEILDNQNPPQRLRNPIQSAEITLDNTGGVRDRERIRIKGVLPDDFNSGYLNTRITEDPTNGPVTSGVDFNRVALYIDSSAVDSSGFTGNLSTTDDTLQKIAQKFNDYTSSGGGTDDQTAAEVSISSTPREAFSDPNIFPGGVRGVSYSGALEAFEANPNDVRAALRSIDFRLQNVYNPFEENEVLDHTDGATTSSDFVLNSSAQIVSNPITIPQELRDLSTDVDIRLRIRVSDIGTGWVGDIQLVHTHYDRQLNPSTVTYGNAESVTTGTKSAGDYVTFERTIQASMVPEQFKVRFRRTGGTTSATFHRGITWVFDSLGSGAMGGVGGQSSSYSSTIIWLAGATINDRIDVASEVTNYDLMSGHRFSDYDQLAFVFDGGAGSTQPLIACWVDANLFQAFGATGTLWIVGNWWLMVSRQSPTQFRWRWRAPSNGLRRIIGIRTN